MKRKSLALTTALIMLLFCIVPLQAVAAEDAIEILEQPESITVEVGEDADFFIDVDGPDDLRYQWQVKAPNAADFEDAEDSDDYYFFLAGMELSDSGTQVRCVLSSAAAEAVTSDIAVITVISGEQEEDAEEEEEPADDPAEEEEEPQNDPSENVQGIAITIQPQPVKATEGETALFTIDAEGDSGLFFQWQKRARGYVEYENIPGALDATYESDILEASDSHTRFRCVVSDGAGRSIVSDSVNLLVKPLTLDIIEQPRPAKVSVTQSATYSVTVEGPGTLSYQWQKRSPGASDYADIPGATEALYTTEPAALLDCHTRYRCVIISSIGINRVSDSANFYVQS